MGTLTPAYGRDYKSQKELLADWNAGKDFQLNSFRGVTYCSKRDFPKGTTLQARYSRNMKVMCVKA